MKGFRWRGAIQEYVLPTKPQRVLCDAICHLCLPEPEKPGRKCEIKLLAEPKRVETTRIVGAKSPEHPVEDGVNLALGESLCEHVDENVGVSASRKQRQRSVRSFLGPAE